MMMKLRGKQSAASREQLRAAESANPRITPWSPIICSVRYQIQIHKYELRITIYKSESKSKSIPGINAQTPTTKSYMPPYHKTKIIFTMFQTQRYSQCFPLTALGFQNMYKISQHTRGNYQDTLSRNIKYGAKICSAIDFG